MIIFIDLGDQITEGCKEFAWYDTIPDQFIEFNGVYTWEIWDRFKEDFEQISSAQPLERFKGLFPKDWEGK